MKMFNFILFFIFLLGSCRPDPVPPLVYPPLPCKIDYLCDSTKLDIVWQTPLSWDTAEWASTKPPIIFQDNVLFTRFTFDEQIDTLKQLNRFSGKTVWTWADYQGRTHNIAGTTIYFANNKFLFTTWRDVYAINASDGQLAWKILMSPEGSGDPFMTVTNGKIYHTHNKIVSRRNIASYLVQSDINIGKWDTAYTQNMIGDFEPDCKPPAIWYAPNGDEILIFQIRYYDFIAGQGRIDAVAYNSTKKETYFRFENIDPYFAGSVRLPFVLKDKVYIPLTKSVICFDMLSKQKAWHKEFGFDGNFTSGQPFIYAENQFFIKPSNRTLYQLDPNTGAEIWVEKEAGSGNSNMVYFDGMIYYTGDGTGKIYALNIATKKFIWAEKSPNYYYNKFNNARGLGKANIGFGGVAIDPVNRLLYTSDNYFAMCIRLPKK